MYVLMYVSMYIPTYSEHTFVGTVHTYSILISRVSNMYPYISTYVPTYSYIDCAKFLPQEQFFLSRMHQSALVSESALEICLEDEWDLIALHFLPFIQVRFRRLFFC